MLFQQLLWIGWMTYCWMETQQAEVLYFVAPIAAASDDAGAAAGLG